MGLLGTPEIRWKECDSPRQRARAGSLQVPALMDETRCRGVRVVLVQVRYDRREGRMKRLCAWATPGNGGEDPLGRRRRQNATPVYASMGLRVILSQWGWCASQRTRIAPDLIVAMGEAANG